MSAQLKVLSPSEVKGLRFDPIDPIARDQASAIIAAVRDSGRDGLLSQAVQLGDVDSTESKFLYGPNDLEEAFRSLSQEEQARCYMISQFTDLKSTLSTVFVNSPK